MMLLLYWVNVGAALGNLYVYTSDGRWRHLVAAGVALLGAAACYLEINRKRGQQ